MKITLGELPEPPLWAESLVWPVLAERLIGDGSEGAFLCWKYGPFQAHVQPLKAPENRTIYSLEYVKANFRPIMDYSVILQNNVK